MNSIIHTHFFWGNSIGKQVKCFFRHQSTFMPQRTDPYNYFKNPYLNALVGMFCYYVLSYLRYPILMRPGLSYWGHCHLPYSKYLVHNNKINLIEDGLSNYETREIDYHGKRPHIYKFVYGGPLSIKNYSYYSFAPFCHKVYLTGLVPDSPVMKQPNTVKISYQQLWNECSDEKKQLIRDIFDFSTEDVKALEKAESIILTQPFSEIGTLTEEEKITFYKKKIEIDGIQNFIIKVHPGETTDYRVFFPNVPVFSKPVPMTLLTLCGAKFKDAYSFNSTASFDFPKETKIHTWWDSAKDTIAQLKNPTL